MYRRIWTFGLAHEEHLLNEYIATAMADYGPGIVESLLADPSAALQRESLRSGVIFLTFK